MACIACKVMKSIIINEIISFMTNKNLLTNLQNGSLVRKLKCVLRFFFKFLVKMFQYSLLQDKHLYFIKPSLTLSYSRKNYNLYILFYEFLPLDYQQDLMMNLHYQHYFVRYRFISFITIFINLYNLFFYLIRKRFVLLFVFSYTFKSPFTVIS